MEKTIDKEIIDYAFEEKFKELEDRINKRFIEGLKITLNKRLKEGEDIFKILEIERAI